MYIIGLMFCIWGQFEGPISMTTRAMHELIYS
jgi:hypothetical protein